MMNRRNDDPMKKQSKAAKAQKKQSAAAEDPRARCYAEKLSRMVRFDTTSYPYSEEHPAAEQYARFLEYHRILAELFPLVHENLEKTDLEGSLLYHWKGASGDRPIVLMGHQDVVPAAGSSSSGSAWEYPPFSGAVADGKVWGRGSVDTKCSCMAILQAIEELLAADASGQPPQDIYFSTSCTEEWGGPGCPSIVGELRRRGVKPWLVCDEGGGIYRDPMPGVRGMFAMIGVGEKGRANLRFIARGEGGHASTPRKNTPIARIAAFVHHVEKHSPFHSRMEPETRAMLEAVSPAAILPFRLALQNLWLFGKPIELAAPGISGQAAAMLGTTITFTMISGGDAFNVFPAEASVGANLRFSRHEDMEESLAIIRKKAEKYGLEMEVIHASPCTKRADLRGEAYRYVEETVEKTFPGLRTSPYILTAATDAAFYDEICESCIRFAPIVYGPSEKKGIHGTNEALTYSCLPGAVDFYKNLITGTENRAV
ncbi:MAG: M20/M25/M40 family metallo-hydrolase [Eubacteriales bacterium]|nr:M20/M25/M40 family metallo-hydrolase [Eubacteriales bacterium]